MSRPASDPACKAKSVCSEGGGQVKRMTLANDGQGDQLGEQITLVMRRSAGLKAVVIAYLVPVILVVAALLVFQTVQIKETVAAISTLVLLGLYFLVIRLLRGRLNRELTIEIEKEIGQ